MVMNLDIRDLSEKLVKLKLTLANLQTFETKVNMNVIRVDPSFGLGSHSPIYQEECYIETLPFLLSKQESEGSFWHLFLLSVIQNQAHIF